MSDNTQDNGRSQAISQFNSIWRLVENLRDAQEFDDTTEYAERDIHEDALSVEVRSDWFAPGGRDADSPPAEYRILLCTGGPAVQLVGALSEYGEPETARLEYQDWFTPWSALHPMDVDTKDMGEYTDILLVYARCFYFGE